jgi:predicted ATPase
LLDLARLRGDVETQLIAHRAMGTCLCQLGDFTSSSFYLQRALSLYTPEKHRSIASVAGYDVRVSALNWLMIDLFALGQLDTAASLSKEVLDWSHELRHPNSKCFALGFAAIHKLLRRECEGTEALVDQLTNVAKDQGFPFWWALADILRGYLLVAQGQPSSGLELIQRSFAKFKDTGAKLMEGYFLYLISQCCRSAGRVDEAASTLEAALKTVDVTGENWFAPELHRTKGDWMMAGGHDQPREIEQCYQRAIEIAGQQSAKMWQLRAAMSMARLWRDQGKRDEARGLLTPVYNWFTEGFDTLDLKEAKALLDTLAA